MTKANKTKRKSRTRRKRTNRRDPNVYPKGWDAQSIKALAEYYDNQSDEEGAAELEAAFENQKSAMIQVPLKLVPAVQKLLARRAG